MKTIEERARAAASQWCRCHKCDGIAHNLISESLGEVTFKCDKDKLQTSLAWYDGYRTALIALGMEESINEEELDRLAVGFTPIELIPHCDVKDGKSLIKLLRECFKAGYRKAMK